MKNKNITRREEDFANWYDDVISAAKLANYSNIKGSIILEPNGYAIWEMIQKNLDNMFKETGHKNVYLPLLIPESLINKEQDLIAGFSPEIAWVTHGGEKKLEERLGIRPTSETLFSNYYASVVKSYRDLPLKYNQWCNVFRWEKETRPFLRGREFLWQEGHTVHETKKEAEQETLQMLNIYKRFFHDYLAIPAIVGKKTEKEKFAGAVDTYTVEALMYNGVCLQSATSHYFGQKFSKAYDIKFLNRNNELEYAYQTSWGATTRMIGALIMVHSDDNGLILPPKIAPTPVIIVPLSDDKEIVKLANKYAKTLNKAGINTEIDFSDKTPGFKFAEAEVKGYPLRIEIGKRDLEKDSVTFVRRDTREKELESKDCKLVQVVQSYLDDIQNNLYYRAFGRQEEKTFKVTEWEEFVRIINENPGFVKAMWCGSNKCEEKIKEIRGTKSRCIPFKEEQEHLSDKCICCGEKAKEMVVWGIQY